MSRTVVSYDDITDSGPPPAKRQKKSGGGGGRGGWKKNSKGQGQHNQNQNQNSKPKEKAGKGEKGRELTHEEIWDDSALLDAWNAATAEYEAYHGPGKGWKNQNANEKKGKGVLWYNIPPSAQDDVGDDEEDIEVDEEVEEGQEEGDSHPIDFNTFQPTHDPSLSQSIAPSHDNDWTTLISKDEAFTRAMTASYWSGYWTAVYHSQNQNEGEEEDEEAEEEGFVSTQR